MRVFYTNEFVTNSLLAEKGIKFVIKGYCFVKDTKGWLKRQAANDYKLKEATLEDLQENCQLVTSQAKQSEDILDDLFDVSFTPTLELTTPDVAEEIVGDIIPDARDEIIIVKDDQGNEKKYRKKYGGDAFGEYRIRVNSGLNNNTMHGIEGTYRAIALVGETYTENAVYSESTHKSYLAMLMYFDGADNTEDKPGEFEGKAGLTITDNCAFTIFFQFCLSEIDYRNTLLKDDPEMVLAEDYAKIVADFNQQDQTTIKWETPGIFLTPPNKEYSHRVTLEDGLKKEHDEIVYFDKNIILIPESERNNHIFNVKTKVMIFDDHNNRFVHPQMMLSYGGIQTPESSGTFINQSMAFEYDPKWFALNEKAPTASTRFDLFGGATKRQVSSYYDPDFAKMNGYLRLMADGGKHFGGNDSTFITSKRNEADATFSNLYLSDDNELKQTDNTTIVDSRGNVTNNLTNGFIIDADACNFNDDIGLTTFGTLKTSAFVDVSGYDISSMSAISGSAGSARPPAGNNMFIGLNTSSVDFAGFNNIYIGYKGLLGNYAHDAIIFGKHNSNGNKEYDRCDTCFGDGLVRCTACCFNPEKEPNIAAISRPELYNPYGLVPTKELVTCPNCQGYGLATSAHILCDMCGGDGKVDDAGNITCIKCDGTGILYVTGNDAIYACEDCRESISSTKGTGLVKSENTIWSSCSACSGYGKSKCLDCSGNGFIENYEHKLRCSGCESCRKPTQTNNGLNTESVTGLLKICPVCSSWSANACITCSGTGVLNNEKCWNCEGTGKGLRGYDRCDVCRGDGYTEDGRKCPNCEGTGKNIVCSACGGDKQVCLTCTGEGVCECPDCNTMPGVITEDGKTFAVGTTYNMIKLTTEDADGNPKLYVYRPSFNDYMPISAKNSWAIYNGENLYECNEQGIISDLYYFFFVGNPTYTLADLLHIGVYTYIDGVFEKVQTDADSILTVLTKEEKKLTTYARGMVGCYSCNDGYPNNLEDCPYCSGRGKFFGTEFGWAPNDLCDYYNYGRMLSDETNSQTVQYGLLSNKEFIEKHKNYLASNVWLQVKTDIGDNAITQCIYDSTEVSQCIYDVLGQYGASLDVKTSAAKFNVNGGVVNNAKICTTCDGRGYIDKLFQKCPTCEGRGYVTGYGQTMWWVSCLHCGDISNIASRAGMPIVRNYYNKLLNNMSDKTMPIMQGKKLPNNKNGYSSCDLCDGYGIVNSNYSTNTKYVPSLDNVIKIGVKHEIDDRDISINGSVRNITEIFSTDRLYVYDDTSKSYVSVESCGYTDVIINKIEQFGKIYYTWIYQDKEYSISNDTAFYKFECIKLLNGKSTAIKTCTTCNGKCITTDDGYNEICGRCYGTGKFTDYDNDTYTEYEYKQLSSLEYVNIETNEKIENILDFLFDGTCFNNNRLRIDYKAEVTTNKRVNALKNYFNEIIGEKPYICNGYSYDYTFGDIYSYWWGHAAYGPSLIQTGFLCEGAYGRGPCPKCCNSAYFCNNALHADIIVRHGSNYTNAAARQTALLNAIISAAKENGQQFNNYFNQCHNYSGSDLTANAYVNELGVTAYCDACNPNGTPQVYYKDGLIVSANDMGQYPAGSTSAVGLIDCNTCGNNGLEAGVTTCTGCLGLKHWYCTTCNGDGEVEYRPTVAYEDGKKVAVGDGYYYENLFPRDKSEFNLYNDYINIKPDNNCDIGRGEYIKKMNLFSVENNGLLTVHNNNYDEVPTSDVKHNINRDFFAVRDWAKYDSLDERFANLQNCCYSTDAIYFPKRTVHNEEWKLRIRELYYLITDSYIKTNASMLKTAALNQAIADFYTNNTTYLLKLGPIITYSIKGVWKKGAKGSKGVKGVTTGTKGKKGMKGLKGLKGTKGAKGYYQKIVIENKRYKYTLPDILAAVKSEYGQTIMNSGNLGKDTKTYTFYCINEDSENYLWFKGVRIRKLLKGRYQTLNVVKGCKPYDVQRIIYKNNGYNGEYGIMNFNYSQDRQFLT